MTHTKHQSAFDSPKNDTTHRNGIIYINFFSSFWRKKTKSFVTNAFSNGNLNYVHRISVECHSMQRSVEKKSLFETYRYLPFFWADAIHIIQNQLRLHLNCQSLEKRREREKKNLSISWNGFHFPNQNRICFQCGYAFDDQISSNQIIRAY